MTEILHIVNFNSLNQGKLGVSGAYGSFLSEAASYCLYLNQHPNPVLLSVSGDISAATTFHWDEVNESHSRTYSDLQEATEYGAYGVALVIAVELTGIRFVERSAKETGIDYWLGNGTDDRGIFQRTARLEVSGILQGGEKQITARLKTKSFRPNAQTTPSCQHIPSSWNSRCQRHGSVRGALAGESREQHERTA